MESAIPQIINLLGDEEINKVMYNIIGAVRSLTLMKILPLVMSLFLIKSIYKFIIENKRIGINLGDISKVIITIIAVTLSSEIIFSINSVANGIIVSFPEANKKTYEQIQKGGNEYTLQIKAMILANIVEKYQLTEYEAVNLKNKLSSITDIDNIKTKTKDYLKEINKTEEITKSLWEQAGGIFSDAISSPTNILNQNASKLSNSSLSVILMTIFVIVSFVMGMLIQTLFMCLACLAPLAFTFNLLFQGISTKWLQILLITKASFLTYMIIEVVNIYILTHNIANVDVVYIKLGTTLTATICYVMVFWFSSKYIGGENAGEFFAKTGAVLTGTITQIIKRVGRSKE